MKGLRSISVLPLSKGAFQKNWADFWLSEFHREGSTWNGECLAWRLLLNKLSKLNKWHNSHFLHFLHFTLFKPGSHPRVHCGIWQHKPTANLQGKKKPTNSSSSSTWPLGDTRAECHLWVMILQTAQALALYTEKQEKVCSACSAVQAPFRSSHLPRGWWTCEGCLSQPGNSTEDKGRKPWHTQVQELLPRKFHSS